MTEQLPNDIEVLVKAAKDAMTDGMVERLTTTVGHGLEVLDRLNDEDTKEAVNALIDGLTELHRSGALESALQMVSVIHAARNALTDGMLERLVSFVEHFASTIATEEIATLAHETITALEETICECNKQPQVGGGVMSLVSMMSKPETQRTLRFFLMFAGKFQGRAQMLAPADNVHQ